MWCFQGDCFVIATRQQSDSRKATAAKRQPQSNDKAMVMRVLAIMARQQSDRTSIAQRWVSKYAAIGTLSPPSSASFQRGCVAILKIKRLLSVLRSDCEVIAQQSQSDCKAAANISCNKK
jgi:hypothetical protein